MWSTYKILHLIQNNLLAVGDGYRAKISEFSSQGLPFVRAGNISDDISLEGADLIGIKSLESIGEKISKPWDVVFTSKGTVGRFAIVKKNTPRFVYSPQLCYWRVKDQNVIEPRFLYYWMQSREFRLQYNSVKAQTDMADYVSLGDQRNMQITMPRLDEQRAIAHILGTLDDKIELNRMMNEPLEAMARAIFKSWFVDFDPVRAKMEGREPVGMNAETAALFPDTFEDSELGEIPKGWRVGVIQDLGEVICGKTPPTIDPENYGDYMQFITIPDMHRKVFVIETARGLSRKGVNTQINKTLPPYSICVSCIATPGLVSMTCEPSQTNQQINSVIPRQKETTFYCYYALLELAEQIRARGSGGSVVVNLNKGDFSVISVLLPNIGIIRQFNRNVVSFFEKLLSNEKQSRTLAQIRDALLPKLLSGEIRIKDVEKIAEQVL